MPRYVCLITYCCIDRSFVWYVPGVRSRELEIAHWARISFVPVFFWSTNGHLETGLAVLPGYFPATPTCTFGRDNLSIRSHAAPTPVRQAKNCRGCLLLYPCVRTSIQYPDHCDAAILVVYVQRNVRNTLRTYDSTTQNCCGYVYQVST